MLNQNSESLTKSGLASLTGAPAPARHLKHTLSLKPSLTQLAARGDIAQLTAILEHGVDDVDVRSPNGSTPLVLAARYGQRTAVELLLDHGAVSIAEAHGAAEQEGHIEIAALLARRLA